MSTFNYTVKLISKDRKILDLQNFTSEAVLAIWSVSNKFGQR
jgi:hypothetical protein